VFETVLGSLGAHEVNSSIEFSRASRRLVGTWSVCRFRGCGRKLPHHKAQASLRTPKARCWYEARSLYLDLAKGLRPLKSPRVSAERSGVKSQESRRGSLLQRKRYNFTRARRVTISHLYRSAGLEEFCLY
jgi:hypothetical protein